MSFEHRTHADLGREIAELQATLEQVKRQLPDWCLKEADDDLLYAVTLLDRAGSRAQRRLSIAITALFELAPLIGLQIDRIKYSRGKWGTISALERTKKYANTAAGELRPQSEPPQGEESAPSAAGADLPSSQS